MAIGEIMSLAGLIKVIVSSKRELNKEYFANFIQPTWELFSKIHDDYKSSLRDYSNLINADGASAEAIIEKIRQDLILTEDLRSELSKIFSNFPSRPFALEKERDSVSAFMNAMYRYFQSQKEVHVRSGKQTQTLELVYSGDFWDKDFSPVNIVRIPLLIHLSRKVKPTGINQGTRKEAIAFFEGVSLDIQKKYGEVAQAYYELKKTILA